MDRLIDNEFTLISVSSKTFVLCRKCGAMILNIILHSDWHKANDTVDMR